MKNNIEIINTIKLLIYGENKFFLEKVDLEYDCIFFKSLFFCIFQ